MNDTRYASRKFILAAFLELAALGLLIAGLIDAAIWKDFSVTILMLYMAGNVGAAFVEKKAV